MKIALLTCRELKSEFGDFYEAFPQPLAKLLHDQNYQVLAIPNLSQEISEVLAFLQPSLIVLTGGESLGLNADRDDTEDSLLDYAVKNPKLKVFGICRGLQVMITKFGGTLTPTDSHEGVLHKLTGKGYEGEVNSFHKFRIDFLTKDFSILATSEDGSIEAVRHKTLPWVGWMWHPERMPMPPWMLSVFQDVVK